MRWSEPCLIFPQKSFCMWLAVYWVSTDRGEMTWQHINETQSNQWRDCSETSLLLYWDMRYPKIPQHLFLAESLLWLQIIHWVISVCVYRDGWSIATQLFLSYLPMYWPGWLGRGCFWCGCKVCWSFSKSWITDGRPVWSTGGLKGFGIFVDLMISEEYRCFVCHLLLIIMYSDLYSGFTLCMLTRLFWGFVCIQKWHNRLTFSYFRWEFFEIYKVTLRHKARVCWSVHGVLPFGWKSNKTLVVFFFLVCIICWYVVVHLPVIYLISFLFGLKQELTSYNMCFVFEKLTHIEQFAYTLKTLRIHVFMQVLVQPTKNERKNYFFILSGSNHCEWYLLGTLQHV